MFLIDTIVLVGSLLVIAAVFSRKLSARFGIPVLVLFLLLGMLSGSEGIGRIWFSDFELAHRIGTVSLVVILFNGGLQTDRAMLRTAWKPASVLATLGVIGTALITGAASAWILDTSLLNGMLIGSIVASTDAAAVFSTLRTAGVRLSDKLNATLEIESGSNDPMAVFLTVGTIEIILGDRPIGLGLVTFFLMQMGLGGIMGFLVGKVAALVINRVNLDTAGLYPVLVLAVGMLSYGVTVSLGGSGYLAAYVTGIVLGNSRMVYQRGTFLFHDGLAWVSQIVMFVVLGLLSFPSSLLDVAWSGLAIAAVLMFVSRPISVYLSLLSFRYTGRELAFISWVGLKGAVPVILAIYPLLYGVPNGVLVFNVVFFVVLLSALTQGWTLPVVARYLHLDLPDAGAPPLTLDITSLHHIDADIVDYRLSIDSAAAGLRLSELNLPEEAVVALVTRGTDLVPARGPTMLMPEDHVFLIMRPELREQVDKVFASGPIPPSTPIRAGVYLPGSFTIEQLEDEYGILLRGLHGETLVDLMKRHLKHPLHRGDFWEGDDVRLFVHRADDTGYMIGLESLAGDW